MINTDEKRAFKDRNSLVYFIEAPSVGLIKIGHALSPLKRYQSMLTGCPVPLKLLGWIPGGWKREADIHAELRAFHSHGEWFQRCEPLERIMADMEVCSIPASVARPSAIVQPWRAA